MLSEKRALKRFILIYLLTTIFLVGIGEVFYYKLAYNNLLKDEKLLLQKDLDNFLQENKYLMRAIKFNRFNNEKGVKYLLYFNGELISSNSKKLDLTISHKESKKFGDIELIVTKKLNKDKLSSTIKDLILFNIFLSIFLVVVSIFLGRLFLAPMRESINRLEEFIADATHEMNTPITTILANIETLPTTNKQIKRIKNSAIRLYKIFKDLKYLKLNHNRAKKIEEINFKDSLLNSLNLFNTAIENKNLKVQLSIEDLIIKIDQEDLDRLIENLLSNAIKYSPNDSTIYISLEDGVFCVKNRGEIENIENLTKKFYRENRSEGGFGLGLHIVYNIAKEYNYKLEIKNNNGYVNVCLYLV